MAPIVRIQPLQTRRARRLRREETDAEGVLWQELRARKLGGWKFKRQVTIGPFIVDFLCLEASLVIELDGGVHETQIRYDARRTAFLQACGLRVARFANDDVFGELGGVCAAILLACSVTAAGRHFESGQAPAPPSP